MHTSSKITIVPTIFFEHLLQDQNKHQIMNVYTKRNCLMPILAVSGLKLLVASDRYVQVVKSPPHLDYF